MFELRSERVVDLIDAVYDPAPPAAAGMGILTQLQRMIGKNLTVASFEFESREVEGGIGFTKITPGQALGREIRLENAIAEHLALPPPVVLALFQRSGAHTTSVASGMGANVPNSPHWRNIWTVPVVDALGLIMRDPSGIGACVCVGLHETTKLDRRRAAVLAKVAMHMAAGMRLRASALDVERADAILSSSGKVLHATERSPLAESLLHEGYRRRGVARKTKHDAEKALEIWQGLIAGRWSLVDFIDTDGKRLVLAMKNAPRVDRRSDLTPNELRVAALAAMGHRDKEIAYMLGLTPSAVAGALARARRKLDVSSRAELARVWRQDSESPSPAFTIDQSGGSR